MVKLYCQLKPERQPKRKIEEKHFGEVEAWTMPVKCVVCPRADGKHLQYNPYIQPVKA
jgi:hypothetical protein